LLILRGNRILATDKRRSLPFGVLSEKKTREKLDYVRNNRVARGLAASPGNWPWWSWRFCKLGDRSILEMDRLDLEWPQAEFV
jgi:hypothetical protein